MQNNPVPPSTISLLELATVTGGVMKPNPPCHQPPPPCHQPPCKPPTPTPTHGGWTFGDWSHGTPGTPFPTHSFPGWWNRSPTWQSAAGSSNQMAR